MALKLVKGTIERAFEKNLQDIVRGIRNHKDDEAKYITECLDEIKQELKQENVTGKTIAILKLIYLQMLGYALEWAAFHVIEVMASGSFTNKRIGYTAAAQSFHSGTEVLTLATNLIRKDLSAPHNSFETGVALSSLACFVTPQLAADLANDIIPLMAHSKPYIRKKAILMMYKLFLVYPDALPAAFSRLKERLEDSDPGVQAAAVNVVGELARRNPKNYLQLAPVFFKLMTSSSSNWVLIKIIKLFAVLTPLEPRLGKKLIEPLTNLIHNTTAMSLLYECINTVIAILISLSPGVQDDSNAIQLCTQKLRILIEDSDQNLKYLGLLAMSRILATYPKSVQAHKDLILHCLDDRDESIRIRALDLLYGMVSKKNIMEIVRKLKEHAERAEGTHYKDQLVIKIIAICSQNNYQFVTNFEWYITVLIELATIEGTSHGEALAAQLLDVTIRVPSVRSFAVAQLSLLLANAHSLTPANSPTASTLTSPRHPKPDNKAPDADSGTREATELLPSQAQQASPATVTVPAASKPLVNITAGIARVLFAAAYICSEFSKELKNPEATLRALLSCKQHQLPAHVQHTFLHAALKLYAQLYAKFEEEEDADGVDRISTLMLERIPDFLCSAHLEVQERAAVAEQILKYTKKQREDEPSLRLGAELAALFAGELNPVAPKAQRKVPVPEGLDLDAWINEPPTPTRSNSLLSDRDEAPATGGARKGAGGGKSKHGAAAAGKASAGKATSSTGAAAGDAGGGRFFALGNAFGSDTVGNERHSATNELKRPEPTPEELEKGMIDMREARRLQVESNPNYLKSGGGGDASRKARKEAEGGGGDSEASSGRTSVVNAPGAPLPTGELAGQHGLPIAGLASSDKYLEEERHKQQLAAAQETKLAKKSAKSKDKKKRKSKKGEENKEESESVPVPITPTTPTPVFVSTTFDLPEGASLSDREGEKKKKHANSLNEKLDLQLADVEPSAVSPSKEKRKKGEKEKKTSHHHKSKATTGSRQPAAADLQEAPVAKDDAPAQVPAARPASVNLLISIDDEPVASPPAPAPAPAPATPASAPTETESVQPPPAVATAAAAAVELPPSGGDEEGGGGNKKKKKTTSAALKIVNDSITPPASDRKEKSREADGEANATTKSKPPKRNKEKESTRGTGKKEAKSVRVAKSAEADGASRGERSTSHHKRAAGARKKTASTSSMQEEEQVGAPVTRDRTEYEETLTDASGVAVQQLTSPSSSQSAAAGEPSAARAPSSLLDDMGGGGLI